MAWFARCFETLPDPRTGNAKRHNLLDCLTIALTATICGAESCVDFADFAQDRRALFEEFLELPAGLPSHDTFSRLLRLLEAVRAHWSIEAMHWILDTEFGEDLARNRADHGPENLAILRKLALNILRSARPDISIRRKRKRSGWSDEFARSILSQMR